MRGSRGANAAKDGSMQMRTSSLQPSLTLTHDLFDPPPPLQKPNHAIIGEETPQSAKPLQFISHEKGGGRLQSHSNPSQHTALHSQAINGTLERGCLGEGGGVGGRHGAVLNCGHRLVSWQRRERLRRHLWRPQQKYRGVLIRSKAIRR